MVLAGEGMTLIHPFDDPDIIAGQGTIALEIFNTIKEADVIISPVGGGGLISGVASIAKSIKPDTRIIGVQARACPSAYESFRKGKIVASDATASIADGISVKQVGKINFEIIQACVDDMVVVGEEQIAAAMLILLEQEKILVEGAGAVPLAALSNGLIEIPGGSNVVLLISGGNVDSPLLGRIINQGLVKHGRVVHVTVMLSDTPGSLSQLLASIARMEANVLHIYHERNMKGFPINVSCVELELETRGVSHVEEISSQLNASGYDIEIR
jgi:threonine dehydratase